MADVTVTRLGGRSVPGRDRRRLGGLRPRLAHGASRRRADAVAIADVSDDLATIGLWGPRARDILAAATADDVNDAAFPLRERAPSGRRGARPRGADQLRGRARLGTDDPCRRACVWDRAPGRRRGAGLEPFGYRALDALRIEKGYRYFGTDMTMLDTPYEAGLGAFVRLDKGPFIGREALRGRAATRGPSGRRAPSDRPSRRRRLPSGIRRRGRSSGR